MTDSFVIASDAVGRVMRSTYRDQAPRSNLLIHTEIAMSGYALLAMTGQESL